MHTEEFYYFLILMKLNKKDLSIFLLFMFVRIRNVDIQVNVINHSIQTVFLHL